ncbi:hypothetical protein [Amycolatopsis speibonae]|uniref:Uncharacterized protein n=1 Tax=Amycolatopsis speibonae TaxID=1450224 RepID=A0ABV7P4N4_9PSEU
MTEQTTTPEITNEALGDMRDVLVRDFGIIAAEWAPAEKVIAKIRVKFGSVEHFLNHYGH